MGNRWQSGSTMTGMTVGNGMSGVWVISSSIGKQLRYGYRGWMKGRWAGLYLSTVIDIMGRWYAAAIAMECRVVQAKKKNITAVSAMPAKLSA